MGRFVPLTARHQLAAVYYECNFVAGELISCGPTFVDQFRRSAKYVKSHPQGRLEVIE